MTSGYGLIQPRVGMTLPGRRAQPVRRAVLRPHRHRPVLGRGLRHLPGRLRRGLVHRQGHLRGRRVRGRPRRPVRRQLAALARPGGGLVPAGRGWRATSRCSTTTRPTTWPPPRACTAGCAATGRPCPGSDRVCRRLGGRASRQPAVGPEPLEGVRQPAPLAGRTDDRRAVRLRLDPAAGRRADVADHHGARRLLPGLLLARRPDRAAAELRDASRPRRRRSWATSSPTPSAACSRLPRSPTRRG